jgi:Cu(I)/Ag(I) efflux system protein CusF
MKASKRVILAAALAATAAWWPFLASAQAAGPATAMTEGEVRKVDKDNRKITLRHGPIKNLDMPAMTMVFEVPDPSMLDKVKTGDKVLFRAASEGGKFSVTELRTQK